MSAKKTGRELLAEKGLLKDVVALSIDGKSIEAPVWDGSGALWLKRDGSTEETDKDFLASKIHAQLEDGIPLWWRVEIELVVSGKSREEELGNILPEGWKIASAEGPLPLAVDEAGQLKVQVRAGKWILKAEAFRSDNPKEIRYAAGAKPAAEVMGSSGIESATAIARKKTTDEWPREK